MGRRDGGAWVPAAQALEQVRSARASVTDPVDVALEFSTTTREGDLELAGGDLRVDDSLRTAILISIFTNARAERDARLPVDDSDRRGWWGDTYSTFEGDEIGSRLWLLAREKLTQALRVQAVREVERSLTWLIEDGIAAGVEVIAEINATDRLDLQVTVIRPDAQRVEFDYSFIWEGTANAL